MKFKISNDTTRAAVIAYLNKLPEGKEYDCTIERHKVKRSLDQNALYWLWNKCIGNELGYTKDDVHNLLATKFLGMKKIKDFDGGWIEVPMETKTLDTAQFTDYLNRIQVFASAELGIILPDPADLAFASFEDYYKDRI